VNTCCRGNLKERDNLEDLVVNGRIIVKCVWKVISVEEIRISSETTVTARWAKCLMAVKQLGKCQHSPHFDVRSVAVIPVDRCTVDGHLS
jgi:hypothetical protein